MAATASVEKRTSRALRRMLDFDPDSGSATLVTLDPAASAKCVAIAEFKNFLFGHMRSVGTHGTTTWSIIAATAADGTGNTAVVTKTVNPLLQDAVGDTCWIECDVEQIHEVLPTATHVGLYITLNTSTDEGVIYMECSGALYPRTGLTADYIS